MVECHSFVEHALVIVNNCIYTYSYTLVISIVLCVSGTVTCGIQLSQITITSECSTKLWQASSLCIKCVLRIF
jgi:hypothetical protein